MTFSLGSAFLRAASSDGLLLICLDNCSLKVPVCSMLSMVGMSDLSYPGTFQQGRSQKRRSCSRLQPKLDNQEIYPKWSCKLKSQNKKVPWYHFITINGTSPDFADLG